ncbi:hypothetical protein SAMN04488104_10734 [Algoriphagus faecimaris]|uniref:Uncharacterized protein n=1 Tax=Algoriphagus faecimaris TaxID=686796 RepID=A0A1G6XZT6_9BACT|nr:hypothetical protein [Algoriphagus faecimaris]SDD83203.1 hypothetical protein SAMN04488104_10734 [Algoriphagus faecimaris]
MSESIKRMDEIINSLVSWLNDYPRHILTFKQKKRIEGILKRLERSEPIDPDEIQEAISNEYERVKKINLEIWSSKPVPNLAEYSDRFNYYYCEGCNERVLKKEQKNHRKTCNEWNQIHKEISNEITLAQSGKGTGSTFDQPGKTYESTGNQLKDEYNENRRLGGDRDIYLSRDQGKFGSYPSMDDYGDESSP